MDCKNSGYLESESIVFDIDGVLVNVDRSYDLAIIQTVKSILNDNFSIDIKDIPFKELISRLRYTGGFNNDIDTAYSIILVILYCILNNKMSIKKTLDFFHELTERLDDKGIKAIEKELEKIGDIKRIKNKLDYPNTDDIISNLFNELFYGPDLFKKQFNREPKYYFGEPFIKNDTVIINERTINYLFTRFKGNLGLISGRSKVASYFTLDKIMHYFDKEACVFLEDEKRELSKPSTFSLHQVTGNLNVNSAIYVGDSVEDLLMVEYFNNENKNKKIFFCGVYGGGNQLSSDKKKIFESKNADIIIENVNELPNILNNTKKNKLT